jgi:hypothetical protein
MARIHLSLESRYTCPECAETLPISMRVQSANGNLRELEGTISGDDLAEVVGHAKGHLA